MLARFGLNLVTRRRLFVAFHHRQATLQMTTASSNVGQHYGWFCAPSGECKLAKLVISIGAVICSVVGAPLTRPVEFAFVFRSLAGTINPSIVVAVL